VLDSRHKICDNGYMVILVDQDGPLADFERGFLVRFRTEFPHVPFIPYEKRKTFYIHDDYPASALDKIESICYAPGFYRNLPQVPGAREALEELLRFGHDVRICTSPLSRYEHCVLEKYEWVDEFFGHDFTRRIILTKDKTLIRGDMLIDDKPKIEGVLEPLWEQVVFDMPFNQNIEKKKRLVGWSRWRGVLLES